MLLDALASVDIAAGSGDMQPVAIERVENSVRLCSAAEDEAEARRSCRLALSGDKPTASSTSVRIILAFSLNHYAVIQCFTSFGRYSKEVVPPMSDPLSITLAVLPLLVETLKAYRAAHRRLKIFCNSYSELKKLHKKIRKEKLYFQNECHLLLRACGNGESSVKTMMHDHSSQSWQDSHLDKRLQTYLRENLECCIETIQEAKAALDQLDSEMDIFGESGTHRLKVCECTKDPPIMQ